MIKYTFQQIIIFALVLITTIILLVFSLAFIGHWIYEGDYKISNMRLSNFSQDGKEYCDNCLWIELYEGCNRYKEYYFENQHEYDKRLEVGMPVDILFKKINDKYYIKNVIPRKEYASKC